MARPNYNYDNNNDNSKYDAHRFNGIEEAQVNPDRRTAGVPTGQKRIRSRINFKRTEISFHVEIHMRAI
jgi:hypothetical protein